ncbi:MAG: phosphatidate cytidylyltransferase [Oscillospiraceae bacterium]|nr:phosphatidate cytidylyltransferase [Oscillospiraceae bacterium]
MLTRVLVAVVGIPVMVAILMFFPPVCLPFILAACCAIAVYEALAGTGKVAHKGVIGISMILAALVPFWYYFGAHITSGISCLFVYFFALCCMAMRSDHKVDFGQMGASVFAALLIPLMLSVFVLINDLEHAKVFIMLPFFSAFASDAFALFAGMAFGKHKLAPKLSPKKTVEGSAGGFAGSAVFCLIYGLLMQAIFGYTPNLPVLVLYGVLGSLVSQLGDLSFSYIKRETGIKDYGNLIPGHGGILDRFDSVIFCAPFTYSMVALLPFFTFQ